MTTLTVHAHAEALAAELEHASAETILAAAAARCDRLAITVSLQDTVLVELAHRVAPHADLIFLDTGYHFPETLAVAAAVEARYPELTLRRITPELTPTQQDLRFGIALFSTDAPACCRMRKVEPLHRTLAEYDGWVTGLRRSDSTHRAHTPAVEIDRHGRWKFNPLITVSDADLDRFIADHDLITHPLLTQGYPSIGCAPCTRAVAPGEDKRSGRWAGTSKTECGLHP